MKLASVVEQHGDGPLLTHLVGELLEQDRETIGLMMTGQLRRDEASV